MRIWEGEARKSHRNNRMHQGFLFNVDAVELLGSDDPDTVVVGHI